MLAGVASASGTAAGVYDRGDGARVDARVRSAQLLQPPIGTCEMLTSRLSAVREQLASHFAVTLGGFEEPKFLRYVAGDYFVPHQDGNTPVIHDDSRHRRISVVLFLNDAYRGGELVLHGAYPNYTDRSVVPAAPGVLVAFRSQTTHEVTPVVEGVRYTVVSWYRA